MNNDAIYQRLIAAVTKHTIISICLPTNPTLDAVTSGVSLYMALTKLGKDVHIACGADIPGSYQITGVDKIQKTLATGGDSLVVSFPYEDGAIDKVTYNIEGNKFNLVIKPREGFEKMNSSNVSYAYTGAKVDMIIVLDAPTLNSLGELYTANQEEFKGKDIVNIDRHLTNANFGTINLVEKKISSTCEIVARLINYLGVQMDKDIATNLYTGITAATNNFTSYAVTPDTFEAVAYLMKNGAVKKPLMAQPGIRPTTAMPPRYPGAAPVGQSGLGGFGLPQANPAAPYAYPSTPYDYDDDFEDDLGFGVAQPAPAPIPMQTINPQPLVNSMPPQPVTPQSNGVVEAREKKVEATKTIEVKEGGEDEVPSEDDQPKTTPKEWLKPKIFRGSNLV